MSDAGDEIQVDAPAAEVEVSTEAPKGKLSVEDALQVRSLSRVLESNYTHSWPELNSKS